MSNSEQVKSWRQRTKQRIIDAMGKECQCCGYNNCNAALELHHVDPKEKEISFGKIMAHPSAWKKIVVELRKCVLLCSNCHREVHNNGRQIPEDVKKFDESYENYEPPIELNSRCPICGKLKSENRKTCSYKCAQSLMGTIKWDDDLLKKMYQDENISINKIAEHFNCSNGSVYKRLKKINIRLEGRYYFISKLELEKLLWEIPKTKIAEKFNCTVSTINGHLQHYGIEYLIPKNYWQTSKNKKPSGEHLRNLVWEIPTNKIGKLYGVSDKAVEKWCKKYNIEKPPRGYWNRRQAGMSHEDAINLQKNLNKSHFQ